MQDATFAQLEADREAAASIVSTIRTAADDARKAAEQHAAAQREAEIRSERQREKLGKAASVLGWTSLAILIVPFLNLLSPLLSLTFVVLLLISRPKLDGGHKAGLVMAIFWLVAILCGLYPGVL